MDKHKPAPKKIIKKTVNNPTIKKLEDEQIKRIDQLLELTKHKKPKQREDPIIPGTYETRLPSKTQLKEKDKDKHNLTNNRLMDRLNSETEYRTGMHQDRRIIKPYATGGGDGYASYSKGVQDFSLL